MSKKILGSLIVAATLLSGGMAFAGQEGSDKIKPTSKVPQHAIDCTWAGLPSLFGNFFVILSEATVQKLVKQAQHDYENEWSTMLTHTNHSPNTVPSKTKCRISEDASGTQYLTISSTIDNDFKDAVYLTFEKTKDHSVKTVSAHKDGGKLDKSTNGASKATKK